MTAVETLMQAEIDRLRAELAKHQESEFHPDWSMLTATRDSLAEHQDMIRRLSEQVRVLRDALRGTVRELQACQSVIHLAGGFDPAYVSDAQVALKAARAALEATR